MISILLDGGDSAITYEEYLSRQLCVPDYQECASRLARRPSSVLEYGLIDSAHGHPLW
jgi:hypothetical protein